MECARRRARVGARGRTIASRESVAYCGSLRQRHRAVKNLFQHVQKNRKKRNQRHEIHTPNNDHHIPGDSDSDNAMDRCSSPQT